MNSKFWLAMWAGAQVFCTLLPAATAKPDNNKHGLGNAAKENTARLATQEALRAKQDKQAAIDQIEGLIAQNSSENETIGFYDIKNRYHWLATVQKNTGILIDHSVSGSFVLLDRDGTVVTVAHARPTHTDITMQFKLSNGSLLGITATDFQYDFQHDVMFATIDPALVSKYELVPVQVKNDDSQLKIGMTEINVGYPSLVFRLHATLGTAMAALDTIETSLDDEGKKRGHFSCKERGNSVTFPGMSGGPVFDQGGNLIGIINSSTLPGDDTANIFTPINFIRAAYVSLYPERAQKADITAPKIPALPGCRFERGLFRMAVLQRSPGIPN